VDDHHCGISRPIASHLSVRCSGVAFGLHSPGGCAASRLLHHCRFMAAPLLLLLLGWSQHEDAAPTLVGRAMLAHSNATLQVFGLI